LTGRDLRSATVRRPPVLGGIALHAAGIQERGPELGPAVADLAAVPGGADKSRVAERESRRRCGIRHRAAVVLAFTAAVLAGADSVTAIAE
jgi:hypothetical protein